MTMGTDDEFLPLARMKETLGGTFCPWWNTMHTTDELSEVMKIWAQDDEYKQLPGSGQVVDSAQALVNWLVIEIGIDVQHIHFNDIKHDSFYDRNVFSLEEWNALRQEQRTKKSTPNSCSLESNY